MASAGGVVHTSYGPHNIVSNSSNQSTTEVLCVFIDNKSSSQANTKGTTLSSRDKRLSSASQGIHKEKSIVSIKERIMSYFTKSYTMPSSFTIRVGQMGKTSIVSPLPTSTTSLSSSHSQNKRVSSMVIPYIDPVVFACDIPFSILRDLGSAILSIGLLTSSSSSGSSNNASVNSVSMSGSVLLNSTATSSGSSSGSLSSSCLSRFLTGLEVWRELLPGLKKDIRLLLTELSLSPVLAATYSSNSNNSSSSSSSSNGGVHIVNYDVSTSTSTSAKVYLYSIVDDRFDILVYDPVVLGKTLIVDKLLQI